MIFLYILAGAALIFIIVFRAVGNALSAPVYKGPITDHFNGVQFVNLAGFKPKGLLSVFKWQFTRKRGKWTEVKDFLFGEPPPPQVEEGIRLTFVNHTTFLIQTQNLNIITDPVWSDRASPFTWMGPQRKRPPGIRMEDLPVIDIILLSHNHYDHLDLATLKMLVQKYDPKIVVPLGVKLFLDEEGIGEKAIELDWWQETEVGKGIRIQGVPAQHFSSRGLKDRNATLWCGYVLHREKGNIYFAGDTGYDPYIFTEIGKQCGPMALSIIPIGAYRPEWFMSPIHCSPAQAVQIHRHVKSAVSVGSHFGTFALADEGQDDPVSDLKKALNDAKMQDSEFITLKEGEGRNFIP